MSQPRMIVEGDNCPEPHVDPEWREYYRSNTPAPKQPKGNRPQVPRMLVPTLLYCAGFSVLSVVCAAEGVPPLLAFLPMAIATFWTVTVLSMYAGHRKRMNQIDDGIHYMLEEFQKDNRRQLEEVKKRISDKKRKAAARALQDGNKPCTN